MSDLGSLFLYIGRHFSTEAYLISSKIQGLLWSAADVVLVLAVLKIAESARRRCGMGKPLLRYGLLCVSLLLTPLLVFAGTPREFFLLESLICGAQFGILLYTVIMERKRILDLVLGSVSKTE
ncbi:MAG: hypothetical protein JXL84_24655 [Deltaproteobacteria bacterium]|nr:hypothetical protein [Deltaproteobacteria bacterium]